MVKYKENLDANTKFVINTITSIQKYIEDELKIDNSISAKDIIILLDIAKSKFCFDTKFINKMDKLIRN